VTNFVEKSKTKYPSLKGYKNERNITYFTDLDYPPQIHRMIYSTTGIERLNIDYKRLLKMRGAMPSAESVLSIMGAVAMKKDLKIYKYPVAALRDIEELKRKRA
jgi:putative transposase